MTYAFGGISAAISFIVLPIPAIRQYLCSKLDKNQLHALIWRCCKYTNKRSFNAFHFTCHKSKCLFVMFPLWTNPKSMTDFEFLNYICWSNMLTVSIMIILSFTIFVLDLVWVNVMVVTLIGHTAFILYYLNKILEYSNGKLVSNGSKISCPVYFEKKKNKLVALLLLRFAWFVFFYFYGIACLSSDCYLTIIMCRWS